MHNGMTHIERNPHNDQRIRFKNEKKSEQWTVAWKKAGKYVSCSQFGRPHLTVYWFSCKAVKEYETLDMLSEILSKIMRPLWQHRTIFTWNAMNGFRFQRNINTLKAESAIGPSQQFGCDFIIMNIYAAHLSLPQQFNSTKYGCALNILFWFHAIYIAKTWPVSTNI